MPNLLVARPMTDLCWVYQKNTRQLQRHQGLTEAEKEVIYNDLQEHQAAHMPYTKETAVRFGVTNLEPAPPNSRDCSMHYSFDCALQVLTKY